MQQTSKLFGAVCHPASAFVMAGAIVALNIGCLYWLWLSVQLGSFGMFVIGILPPAWIITGPVGAWSLLFGAPTWLAGVFG